jgi:hypothetical protein
MPRPDDPTFCSECGTALIPLPKPQKGRLWPPVLFMAVMLTVGCIIFAFTWKDNSSAPASAPWFSMENGELYFDALTYLGGDVLTIPESVNGQTVTAISDSCFQDCDFLTEVIFPDSVTTIGDNAFEDCDGLQGVKLPESITAIGTYAFYDCDALEAIYIPGSVDTIGGFAISDCDALRHIFFVGNRAKWNEVYPGTLDSKTTIYAVSGPDANSFHPI